MPTVEAELARFRQHQALLDQAELIAHIGHYEWSYELDCLLSCSEEYARIHDMTVEQALERHSCWDDVVQEIHPDDRERFERSSAELRRNQALEIDYRLLLENGEVRHIREYAIEVLDESGDAIGTFGILQDISDRVRYEHDMAYRDELARQTEAITDIGHFIFDEENQKYDYVSDGCGRIYGLAAAVFKQTMNSLDDDLMDVLPEDRDHVAAAYRGYVASGADCKIDFRIRRSDGAIRWLRELTRPRRMRNGRVCQTLGVVQDITTRKMIEQELLYKDALATQAELITEIGHFIFDEIQQKYLFVSPGLARIYGIDESEVVRRFATWKQDLELVHPDDRELVSRIYDRYIAGTGEWNIEYRLIRPDGEVRWIRETGRAYVVNHGIPEQTIGVLQDITAQKRTEQEIIDAKESLEQQVIERTRELAATVKKLQEEIAGREKIAAELDFLANHDALTGLPSLRLCKDRLEQSLAEARRNRQPSAVMFLDLDGFKQINDQYGHEFGDEVLKSVARRIKTEIRETDTVARIGGDEFLVILSNLPSNGIAERIAASLIECIANPIPIADVDVCISISIGVAFYPRHGETSEALIRSADQAMYRVKRDGKNGFGIADSGDS